MVLRVESPSETDVNDLTNKPNTRLRPMDYWRLWLFDTVLVSAGMLFFLASQYGTREFFGKACAMGLLPLIPALVLVGGGGSTVFALTKVWLEKRSVPRPTALVLLVGPGLVVTALLVVLVAFKSPAHRLAYICLGNAPASARQVQITGYSTFLNEEWLAVFNVDERAFQAMVAGAKLKPVPEYEFNGVLDRSSLTETRMFQHWSRSGQPACFQRTFNESKEHQRGRVYAAFDPATSTAMVFREFHD